MAAVTKLGSGNKIEVFDRHPASEADRVKASALMAVSRFDFDQQKCRAFMQEHGQALLWLNIKAPTRLALEEVLVEQGLCGGAKERIPCVLASPLEETQQAPYAVVRVIYNNNPNEWQLVAQLDNETIVLRRYDHMWWVEMPCRLGSDPDVRLWQRLIFSPERFLRFFDELQTHFKAEKVALEVLNLVMSRNPAELVMQYAGYPTEAEKQSAEADGAKLRKQVKDINRQNPYRLPYRQEAPAAAEPKPYGILERLRSVCRAIVN